MWAQNKTTTGGTKGRPIIVWGHIYCWGYYYCVGHQGGFIRIWATVDGVLYRGGGKVGRCCISEELKMFVRQILAGKSRHGGLGWMKKKRERKNC